MRTRDRRLCSRLRLCIESIAASPFSADSYGAFVGDNSFVEFVFHRGNWRGNILRRGADRIELRLIKNNVMMCELKR
jgi:hypothetical protein